MTSRASEPAGLTGSFLLYGEDFDADSDLQSDAHEPETIPPDPPLIGFTEEEMEEAKHAAYDEGWQAHARQADARDQASTQCALATIAESLIRMHDSCVHLVEEAASTLARDLLHILATMLPVACARLGAAEAAAVARTILSGLGRTPAVIAQVAAGDAPAIGTALSALDPPILERLSLVPSEALAPGDIRISWGDGEAVRDAHAIWSEIVDVLAPLGLALPARINLKEPLNA